MVKTLYENKQTKRSHMTDFIVGDIYNRRSDIHDVYGGQRQSGIVTPGKGPYIFLFTGTTGDAYGYHDEFRDDGTFWYTGEGQKGNMQMIRGNRAIRDHVTNHRVLAIFEQVSKGHVRFIGWANHLDHHLEERPDIDGTMRSAIVFELAIYDYSPNGEICSEDKIPYTTKLSEKDVRKLSLKDLKEIAIADSQNIPDKKTQRTITYNRSIAVKNYVLKRASGICEGCEEPAPFANKRGQPYLEPHHTHRVSDGGPDHPSHVIALCPTCHSRVHYANDGNEYNSVLIEKLNKIESSEDV